MARNQQNGQNVYYYSDITEYATGFLAEVQRLVKDAVDEIEKNQNCCHATLIQRLKSCYHDKKLPSTISTSQLVKLLDEYNFMKYTKKHPELVD